MADIKKIKDKITSTIYPNGKGAINATDHQAMLLEMADGMADLSYGRNVVNNYETGYISYDKFIRRGSGGNYEYMKFIMLPVSEGEEYAYYSKYSESLFIAFCADKDTWFARQQVVEGWQNFTIPSGCEFLAVSIQFNADQADAVAHAFLYNTKVSEQVFQANSELSKKINEVEKNNLEKVAQVEDKLASGRNIVHYYELGYVQYDKTIYRGGDGRYKFIIIPVSEGEEYAYYSKYSESLFIAFCADKDTWFARQQVVEGWQNFTIPSGCNFLAITIQFNVNDDDAVDNAFLYNLKITQKVSMELENLSDRLEEVKESYVTYQEKVIAPSEDSACTMVVGESPSVNARNDYKCWRIPMKKGDKISILAKSGDSLPSYGLVKDGVFTFVSAKALRVEEIFECDGTYDEIIINNYAGYLGSPNVTKYEIEKVTNSREVNILMLGNSFTQDSMSYVPFIMKNIVPSVKLNLAIGYIGGCPLAQHCANLTQENQVLNGITYSPINYTYQLYESGSASWVSVGSKSIAEMLAEKEWHIITLQQNGSDAAKSWDVCYAPFIYKIHKALYEKVSRTTKLGWLLVHGAYASTAENLLANWKGSAENTQKIQDLTANQIVFPYGTAVQNLRTTSLANLGDGGFLMGDTAHLHEGIGCLTAAYANALTILDCLGLRELSIIGEKTRPNKAWCTEKGVLAPNYGAITNDVIGITEDNCYLAQVAAIQAVKKPYEVTDCSNL